MLGQHNGLIDYTIGQRRGLGIGGRKGEGEDNAPLYVVAIHAASHEVIVGPQSALAVEKVYLGEMNWVRCADSVMPADATEGRDVLVKLRNTAPASRARLFREGSDEICLQLEKPEYGIATGQAGVIYDGQDDSHMLGGGWIRKAPTRADSSI